MLWLDRTQCGGSEILLSAVPVHADARKKKKNTHFSSSVYGFAGIYGQFYIFNILKAALTLDLGVWCSCH